MTEHPTTFGALVDAGILEIGDGYRARNDELGGTGHIFLRAGHVRDTHIDFDGVERFHSGSEVRVAGKLSQPGDTIVTTKGNSTGRTAFVSREMPRFVYSPHLSYWRSRDPLKLSPLFLRYWSRGGEFTTQLAGMKASTDMAPYLSLTDQLRLRITLPRISRQAGIGEILAALDDKIELNRRMNETLEALARALFKSWFVDFDPVRTTAEGKTPTGMDAATAGLFPNSFQSSELMGKIPAGWDAIRLSQAGTWMSGGTPSKSNPEYWGGDIPWVSAKSLSNAVWVHDAEEYVTALGAENGARRVPAGSVLFVVRGMSLASEFRIGLCSREVTFNQDLKAIVPTGRVHPALLTLWLRESRRRILELADEASHGTKRLQTELIGQIPFAAPPPEAQDQLALPLDTLLARIASNDRESDTLRTLRDQLLPKLLSGELRIRDGDEIVERAV